MTRPTIDTALFEDSLPCNPRPFAIALEENLEHLVEGYDYPKRILWVLAAMAFGQLATVEAHRDTRCSTDLTDLDSESIKSFTAKSQIANLLAIAYGDGVNVDLCEEWQRLYALHKEGLKV